MHSIKDRRRLSTSASLRIVTTTRGSSTVPAVWITASACPRSTPTGYWHKESSTSRTFRWASTATAFARVWYSELSGCSTIRDRERNWSSASSDYHSSSSLRQTAN